MSTEDPRYYLGTLRVTFKQELDDETMQRALRLLVTSWDFFNICDTRWWICSPIEVGKNQGRHYHIAFVQNEYGTDHLVASKYLINSNTVKNRMKAFRQAKPEWMDIRAYSFTLNKSAIKTDVETCFRYCIKTGINHGMELCYTLPEFFNLGVQLELGRIQLEARLKHEELQEKKAESHRNSHGAAIYNMIIKRHEENPFKTERELVEAVEQAYVDDNESIGMKLAEIRAKANKLGRRLGIIPKQEMIDRIMALR